MTMRLLCLLSSLLITAACGYHNGWRESASKGKYKLRSSGVTISPPSTLHPEYEEYFQREKQLIGDENEKVTPQPKYKLRSSAVTSGPQIIQPKRTFTGDDAFYKAFLTLENKEPNGRQVDRLCETVVAQVSKHCNAWLVEILEDLTGPLYDQLLAQSREKELVDTQQANGEDVSQEDREYLCATWNRLMRGLEGPSKVVLRALATRGPSIVELFTFSKVGGGMEDAVRVEPDRLVGILKEDVLHYFLDGHRYTAVMRDPLGPMNSQSSILVDYFQREKASKIKQLIGDENEKVTPQPKYKLRSSAVTSGPPSIQPKRTFTGDDAFYKAFLTLENKEPNGRQVDRLCETVVAQVSKHCNAWLVEILEDLTGPLYDQLLAQSREKELVDTQQANGEDVSQEDREYLCATWNRLMRGLEGPSKVVLRALATNAKVRIVVTTFTDKTLSGAKVITVNGDGSSRVLEYTVYHFKNEHSFEGIMKSKDVI